MLKQILIVVVALVVFNAAFVFLGGLDLLVATKDQEEQKVTKVSTDISDVFRFTLEDEVRKKRGQPETGIEPYMFLEVFPGLVETDFSGVEASIGMYQITNGRLIHKSDPQKLQHGSAKAVSKKGMETLLDNIATRTGINLRTDGTITDIMSVLTAQ